MINKIKNYKSLLLTLLFCFIIFAFFGFHLNNKWSDFFINLSASFVIIIFTIFVIDKLLEDQKNRKYRDAHDMAKGDLLLLKNMLTTYLSAPIGFKVDNYIQGDISKFNTLNLLNDILSIDFLKKLNNLSTANWKHLETDLIFIKHELSNKIQLYSNLIPPEILGKLLIVNKEFESLNSLFGLLPDLFTKEQSEWPPNDKGLQNNIRIRTTLLTKLAENFKEYFVSVKNFSDVLEGWEKR